MWIWTRVAVSISCDDNNDTTGTFFSFDIMMRVKIDMVIFIRGFFINIKFLGVTTIH